MSRTAAPQLTISSYDETPGGHVVIRLGRGKSLVHRRLLVTHMEFLKEREEGRGLLHATVSEIARLLADLQTPVRRNRKRAA